MKSRILLFLAVITLHACRQQPTEVPAFNHHFAPYIQSFTSGVISKKSVIRIHLVSELDSLIIAEAPDDLLHFRPEIPGKLHYPDRHTLEFVPDEDMKPGTVYNATLDIGAILDVPDSLSAFSFGFQILKPDYELADVRLEPYDNKKMTWYQLRGSLLSADEEDVDVLNTLYSMELNGVSREVGFQEQFTGRKYQFTVDSIERADMEQIIRLMPNSQIAGAGSLVEEELVLPALGDFMYLSYSLGSGKTPAIHLNFSDPLWADQDLSGLILLEGVTDLKYEIDGNSVTVYPSQELSGTLNLNLHKGILNLSKHELKNPSQIPLQFKNEKPRVQLLGSGNIIPGGSEILLPFKAIGLNAVDIKVVKIPGDNLHQFFQNNSYDGSSELYRVGEVVARKTMDLTAGNLRKWNNYALDLAEIMKPEPGALYRVYFSFNIDQSVYKCEEDDPRDLSDEDYYEDEYWYYNDYHYSRSVYKYEDYYFNYPPGYRWRHRDDPCDISYYHRENFVTRNIMVTDLGMVVKSNQAFDLDITITDLLTAKPVSGAIIKAYNYQGRFLEERRSDKNGWASFGKADKVYLLVAEQGPHKTVVKVKDGHVLPLSNFPVGGASVRDGIKGFVYAERGVWRPGDSIHLNFILENPEDGIPDGHPIQFELLDFNGIRVDRQIEKLSESKIYNFSTVTSASAQTGAYRAVVRIGKHRFEKSVLIETVKPNRLVIDLDLGEKVLQSESGRAEADLAVNWLTGVPSKNSDIQIMLTASSYYRPFKDYSDYMFNDPVYRFERTEREVYKGQVDEEGNAKVTLDIGTYSHVPGMLHGRFVVNAYEGGGDFSTQYFDSKIATYPRYVGMKLEKSESYYYESGKEYNVDLRSILPAGALSGSDELEVKIYTIGRYWWYSHRNGLSQYMHNDAKYLVSSQRVTTQEGAANFKLSVPSKRWGRFLVRICDPEGGHCTGQLVYFDWPEEQRRGRVSEEGSNILVFQAGKEKYEIGEQIKASIPADEGSKVLVTLENGSGILEKHWLEPMNGKVEFSTPATEEMAPNVYISAHLLQPHSQSVNNRPIRLYGIVPVEVYDPKTILEPEIIAADVWRPEQKVNVSVKEKNGKAMEYTIAIVDEGLLNLTNYKTPDPWKHFFAKEALGVSTRDMFDAVLGVFGGTLEQIFAVGGDSELLDSEKSNQNRFKPMIKHLGPFKLEPGAKASHDLKLPNYVGSVKVMVVAAGPNRSYGNAEKQVTVRKPLMVLTSLPRLLSPGDEISLPVTVFAMEPQVKDVNLKLRVEGKAEIVGSSSQKLSFEEVGEEVVDFKLRIPEERGEVKVRIDAESGGEKAYDETELKVRIPSAEETESYTFSLEPGRDTVLQYQPLGVSGGNSHVVIASTMPPLDLEKRMKYLTGYPHGCTEQVVSRAFPSLYLEDLMELDTEMKQITRENVNMALQHIYERQRSDGSVVYWPGYYSSGPNGYITSYAGHFLWEAQQKGYQIAEGVVDRWIGFQKRYANSWRPRYNNGYWYNHLDQAYRLYLLALVGQADLGAMNRFKSELSDQESSIWYLAAAYQLVGKDEVALELATEASKIRLTGTYRYYYYCRSNLRDDAVRLMVLQHLGQKTQGLKVARKIAEDINSSRWYSTHGLAFAIKALLTTYADNARGGDMNWKFTSQSDTHEYAGSHSYNRYRVKRNPDEPYSYTVLNTGSITTNYTVSRTGIPIRFDVPEKTNNLSVYVSYVDLNGNEMDVSSIPQGTQFEAVIRVSRQGVAEGYEEMALTHLIPSGWEVINTRLSGTDDPGNESYYKYRDIRDDRVYTYFTLKHDPYKKFRIRLNASYAGRYYMPPVKAEDMYDHEINANSKGRWVEVVRK